MEKLKKLEEVILYHKSLYYRGTPALSDFEFDKLEDELRRLDPKSYVLEVVGSKVESKDKILHGKKMLSLEKTYSIDDLVKWMSSEEVVSTFKIDGSSCSLVYSQGKLINGKTRGDGQYGEDITEKALWMSTIPKRIKYDRELEVRGEIYCDLDSFYLLAETMQTLKLDIPSSQRNIVAGLLLRKENIDLAKFLKFKAFDSISDQEDYKTEIAKKTFLQNQGFDVAEYRLVKSQKDVENVIDHAAEFMNGGEYLIDGVVFSFNNLLLHEELGETAHHPKYKIAYKFQGVSKTTTLKSIDWQVSRNGILTPVGNIEPIELSDAQLSRVTLHNFGIVKLHQLKAGDVIEIVRSGEVIPKFLNVINSSDEKFSIPNTCPSCNNGLVEEGIRLLCTNEECPARVKEEILHFVKKIGIDDLSTKRLEEMINKKLIASIVDLYLLTPVDFLKLDKFKDKLANKLYKSITASKDVGLIKFLSALGLSGGAENKCEKIVSSGFNTIEKILAMSEEQLGTIESFAEKSSKDFITSLESKKAQILDLIKLGFKAENEFKVSSDRLQLKKLCITGTLSRKRSEIEASIKKNGGIVVSSVTKNTDMLITNETNSSSSKFKKAKDLNIEIVSEEELFKILQED